MRPYAIVAVVIAFTMIAAIYGRSRSVHVENITVIPVDAACVLRCNVVNP